MLTQGLWKRCPVRLKWELLPEWNRGPAAACPGFCMPITSQCHASSTPHIHMRWLRRVPRHRSQGLRCSVTGMRLHPQRMILPGEAPLPETTHRVSLLPICISLPAVFALHLHTRPASATSFYISGNPGPPKAHCFSPTQLISGPLGRGHPDPKGQSSLMLPAVCVP